MLKALLIFFIHMFEKVSLLSNLTPKSLKESNFFSSWRTLQSSIKYFVAGDVLCRDPRRCTT